MASAESTVSTLPSEITDDLYCPDCGYNLRGLTGERCPECGSSIEGMRDRTSRIPWVHRKEIGLIRAYWATVWLVMFRQRRFVNEIAREVNYVDSQSFRWVTILHVAIPVLIGAVIAAALLGPTPFQDEVADALCQSIWPPILLYVCFVLFLAAATGVPSYFFHPKAIPIAQQNRAIALSYYACGPLSVVVLGVPFAVAAPLVGDNDARILCLLLAPCLPAGMLAAWWFDLIHLSRRFMPQRPMRAWLVAVGVPVLWMLLALVILVGLPLSVCLIVMIFFTRG